MKLTGTWKNKLSSTVTLRALDGGRLEGEYHTAVSSAGNPLPPTPLHGSWQRHPDGVLFGITIKRHFVKDSPDGPEDKFSTTAWCGRGLKENPNELQTTWFLTSGSEPAWKLVNINQDVFVRTD